MAGHASNWYKATAGPLKGQALYYTAQDRDGFLDGSGLPPTREGFLAALNGEGGATSAKYTNLIVANAKNNYPPQGAAQRGGAFSGPASTTSPVQKDITRIQAARIGDVTADYSSFASSLRLTPKERAQTKFDKTKGDVALSKLYRMQGFDGKPHVITKDEMDKYVASGETELYRGVSSVLYNEAMRSGSHFAGYGMYGNGTYVARARNLKSGGRKGIDAAVEYANGKGNSQIIRMTLKKGARVADYAALEKERFRAVADYENQPRIAARIAGYNAANSRLLLEDRALAELQKPYLTAKGKPPVGKSAKATAWLALDGQRNTIMSRRRRLETRNERETRGPDYLQDMGRFAAAKGYDAIDSGNGSYLAILNRTALRIQDTDVLA